MNTLPLLSQEMVERLGWTLVHSLWEITAIAVLLGLARQGVRSVSVRYLLAMLALALSVAAPAVTFQRLIPARAVQVNGAPVAAAAPASLATIEIPVLKGSPLPARNIVKAPSPPIAWRVGMRPLLPWAVTAWLLGVACMMLAHLGGWWLLRRLRTRDLVPAGFEIQQALAHGCKRLGLWRTVRVLESSRVLVPVVMGTLKPLVLVPCGILSHLSQRELEAILAHEIAHLRRWDDVANFLQCAVETVLFYHPALWWISRIVREEREICCDELAVSGGVERHDLAQALGHVALWQGSVPQPALAATGRMPVLARIQRLLKPPVPHAAASPWPLLALALLALVAVPLLPAQNKEAKPAPAARGRILDRNGLVLAETIQDGVRYYPYQSLAAHVLGYTGHKSATTQELAGRAGIELSQDASLAANQDLNLTLDARLQQVAEKALLEKSPNGSACVVIDPDNGDVLAMASEPGYDLNFFVSLTTDRFEKLANSPHTPLVARAYQGQYPPGSTFKLVAALGGLASGAIDENTVFEGTPDFTIDGRVFHNWSKDSEGPLDMAGAIRRSCNTWFYQAALKMGQRPILDMAAQLGFGRTTGLPVGQESAGTVIRNKEGQKMPPGLLANLAVGQVVQATPLQAAMATAAFANGGRLWVPRLLQAQPAARLANNLLDHGVTSQHLDLIRQAMVSAVNDEGGTGGPAAVPGVKVAGKTGTAQWKLSGDSSKNRNLAWFTGFAPADHPRIAFAVVYEGMPGESVSGGSTCGPIVRQLVKESLTVLGGGRYEVVPQPEPPSATASPPGFKAVPPRKNPKVSTALLDDAAAPKALEQSALSHTSPVD